MIIKSTSINLITSSENFACAVEWYTQYVSQKIHSDLTAARTGKGKKNINTL